MVNSNLRRGEPRMQREKRKLKVKQKRREEKMEKEISMVYLGKGHILIWHKYDKNMRASAGGNFALRKS